MAKKIFLLIWKTSTNKYQIAKGDDIAEACNNSGVGRGALPALNVYIDVTGIFKKGSAFKTLRIVREWQKDAPGAIYFWKREGCAKLESMFLLDPAYKPDDTSKSYKGWMINDAGKFLLEQVEK